MAFRVPTPDGAKGEDNLPLMVLPPDTLLRNGLKVNFLTVGGMSTVYLGTRGGEKFLVKEVEALDSRNVISLNQEKFILERLNHPQIVKVYDLFEQDGFYYMATDYIDGQGLDKLVSPFPDTFIQEKILLNWAVQLCTIFEYLHKQAPPLIYRDLKPRNVIKDNEGRLHLIDFGIARAYKQGKSKDTEPMGTAITASPEHYGGSQTDQRSDIYTLGATLHYLATNGRCQADEPFSFVPVRTINPRLSENFERVIAKALQHEPSRRYQSIMEMHQALLNTRENPLPVLEPLGEQAGSHSAHFRLPSSGSGEEQSHFSRLTKIAGIIFPLLLCLIVVILGLYALHAILNPSARQSPGIAATTSGSPGAHTPVELTITPSSPSLSLATSPVAPGESPPGTLAVQIPGATKTQVTQSPVTTATQAHPETTATPSLMLPTLEPSPAYPVNTRINNPGLPDETPAKERVHPEYPIDRRPPGNIKVIKPGEEVGSETVMIPKLYRDEAHNFEILLPPSWCIDREALKLDAREGGSSTVAFSHLPPRNISNRPDIVVLVWRKEGAPHQADTASLLEEWVRGDEERRMVTSRLSAPLSLVTGCGNGTAQDVLYARNRGDCWQERLVIADSRGFLYMRGTSEQKATEIILPNGGTLKDIAREIMHSIKPVAR